MSDARTPTPLVGSGARRRMAAKAGFRSSCSPAKEQKQLCCRITRHANLRYGPGRKLSSKRPGTTGCWSAMAKANAAGFLPGIQSRCSALACFFGNFLDGAKPGPHTRMTEWSTHTRWTTVEVLPAANFPLKPDACSPRKNAHMHTRKNFAMVRVSH